MSLDVVDKWSDPAGTIYEVNTDDGFVHASQAEAAYGQDVLSSISPKDALRLATALILAADKAKEHRRWSAASATESD